MKAWTYIAALGVLLLTGCRQDEEGWQDTETGFLLLESVKAEVMQQAQANSRTVDASFTVEILREDGTAVQTFAPGELTTQKIQLEAGRYRLKAYTANHSTEWQNGEKGEAKYYKEQDFAIAANRVNRVILTVPMSNTAITLRLPEGFQEWFTSYEFTVTQGSRHIALQNGETAYVDSDARVSYTLSAVNADGEQKMMSGAVQRTAANTNYAICYSMGSTAFSVKAVSANGAG